MKTNLDPARINAFVDGELDLESQLAIERQLPDDDGLRQHVEGLRQLQATIRENADYHALPGELRERLDRLGSPTTAKPAPSGRAARVERWWGWRPVAVAFGLVAAGALAMNLWLVQPSRADHLLDEVVASHVRSTLGQHLVDVASSDHHAVKPWLSSKLDFSPPVNELHLPDCELLGGRIDYLDHRPVAALVYRKGRHIVNAFVWPSGASDSKADFATERGFQTARWSQGAMTHWVVSDASREELTTIVNAVQAAERER
ncbi:MAG: anti-sigma factor [Pseudomonadota bacterium]|nr:anti-sigma factor [Pseudomonadota bacterium]